jgi:hypothetical protein
MQELHLFIIPSDIITDDPKAAPPQLFRLLRVDLLMSASYPVARITQGHLVA